MVLGLCVHQGYSQTFSEWFKQKKTQIKYLINQIEALKVYSDYLEKGYNIVQQGARVIADIKHGDLNLHDGYFNSLKAVSPAIKKSSRIALILTDQADILKSFNKLIASIGQSGQFTSAEINYIHSVFLNIVNECGKTLDELISLIEPGDLQMKDDERIDEIEVVYKDMEDKYAFTQSFCKETSLLAVQRLVAASEVDMSRKVLGLR